MRRLFLPLIVFALASFALSQPPPPAPSAGPGQVKKFAGWPSITSLPATEQFASLEGRFKIGLPKSIQGFSALSPKQTGSSATGQQYTWKFTEGEVVSFFLIFRNLR